MKNIVVIIYLLMATNWSGLAMTGPAIEGAPELTDALKCEIHLGTNIVVWASNVPIVLTISNSANIEAELPSPVSEDQSVSFRMTMHRAGETGDTGRMSVFVTFFDGQPTAAEKKSCKEGGSVGNHFLSPRWITIPPHGKEEFYGCINITSPFWGPATLQCVISSSPSIYRSPVAFITNEWASAAAQNPTNVAKAKADGRFLLDLKRLWIGKMQSNLAEFTIIKGPK